ncbi:MAG: hypothetical protein JRH01_20480, partial [Deltaproteobacteria bacterium]|nr:hypothetical protein [Deltaproteobacteria bacterium]
MTEHSNTIEAGGPDKGDTGSGDPNLDGKRALEPPLTDSEIAELLAGVMIPEAGLGEDEYYTWMAIKPKVGKQKPDFHWTRSVSEGV